MAGNLQPVHLHSFLLRAEMTPKGARALAEEYSNVFLAADLVDQRFNDIPVAPGEGQTIHILFGNDSLFKQVEGEPDRVSGADGVESIPIAQVAKLDDPFQIGEKQVGSEDLEGLVFGSFLF